MKKIPNSVIVIGAIFWFITLPILLVYGIWSYLNNRKSSNNITYIQPQHKARLSGFINNAEKELNRLKNTAESYEPQKCEYCNSVVPMRTLNCPYCGSALV